MVPMTLERETLIQDLSEKKLGEKQLRLGVALADMFERPAIDDPHAMAVRVLDTIREFNAAERAAKETGQPVQKPRVLGVSNVVERLTELLDVAEPDPSTYYQGVEDSIGVVKQLGGVE